MGRKNRPQKAPAPRRPTLREVAREAGVSHITASRVVRGLPVVADATEKRVRAAVEKVGYRPDPALSALAGYRSRDGGRGTGGLLAFLDCDGTPFSKEVFGGACAEASRYGYSVERQPMPKAAKWQERLGRELYHRGIRGLLFGPSDEEWDFSGWNWTEFAAVSLGALGHKPGMNAVASDYFHAAYSAVRLLKERGAERIGLAILSRLQLRTGHRWLGGYAAALGGENLRIYKGEIADVREFRRWCLKHRVDGLLTIHGALAEHWPEAASRIILLNASGRGKLRQLTHLSLDPGRIGEEGVRFLHQLLLRHDYGLPGQTRTVAVKGTWVLPGR